MRKTFTPNKQVRRGLLAGAGLLSGVIAFAAPGAYAGNGDSAVTTATCVNGVVTVTSTKDISNVVWETQGTVVSKADGLTGTTFTFPIDPDDPVTAVWVKSGNNKLAADGSPMPSEWVGGGVGRYFGIACTEEAGGGGGDVVVGDNGGWG